MVGAALPWALERALGEDWMPEVAAAWSGVYEMLSRRMYEEAYASQS